MATQVRTSADRSKQTFSPAILSALCQKRTLVAGKSCSDTSPERVDLSGLDIEEYLSDFVFCKTAV